MGHPPWPLVIAHIIVHCVHTKDVRVIAPNHYIKISIQEAIEIEKRPKKFNRDDNLILCDSWKPIIHPLRDKTTSRIN